MPGVPRLWFETQTGWGGVTFWCVAHASGSAEAPRPGSPRACTIERGDNGASAGAVGGPPRPSEARRVAVAVASRPSGYSPGSTPSLVSTTSHAAVIEKGVNTMAMLHISSVEANP